ncbi:Na(+)-translocating NADH-quinone reductase subunit A [Estrella lausannensis]|uniref:Na(+)-translocating NADH-quinone reductase subunit A n=1 Tax=Estrella lausannensis TaxID=483423 RepID=A0A0H5DPN7_9BACT|nr:Na(+)-translocating NADH-quinone reductase subunit A [Estrella lausannensis]CRX37449.1 Na(+)-translocating NADH-quinone reductase subunit A [Estrella lausannensis]
MHIKISKGLDIPIKGKPSGTLKSLTPTGQSSNSLEIKKIALDLSVFEDVRFHALKKVGDEVRIGEAIAQDKAAPARVFVSPAGGIISEIRRGEKRRILYVVIDVAAKEERIEKQPLKLETASREEILERITELGIMPRIRQRPFDVLANPTKKPDAIFVRAVESAPFTPSAEMQIHGKEQDFQKGLEALTKLTDGKVHLVYRHDTSERAFLEAKGVERHTVEGPHPIGLASVHIHHIAPIGSSEKVLWVLSAHDAVMIGAAVQRGVYEIERVVSVAGPGIIDGQSGYYKAREGLPINVLTAGRLPKKEMRLISGDPLMGNRVGIEDFLGFYAFTFTAIPEPTKREFLHFFRLGSKKFSFSGAYLSGLFNLGKEYDFTTSQHGEKRAFIDPTLYDEVQPLPVPTMPLVKAIMADDLDLAEELGLLTVAAEDFSLPSFVCPSKIEMVGIVKQGLKNHAQELLG